MLWQRQAALGLDHLVGSPAAKSRTLINILIKFLSADNQEYIVAVGLFTIVWIADVTGGSVRFGVQDSIDEDAHDAAQAAGHGDVVPCSISHIDGAVQGITCRTSVYPKGYLAICDRDAVFAGVKVFVHAAVDNLVAVNPILSSRNATSSVVFTRVCLYPLFDGEIFAADVHRWTRIVVGWIIDLNFQPIDIINGVAIETERVTTRHESHIGELT